MAWRIPTGRTGKTSSERQSSTPVGLRMLATSFFPMRAYSGVTRPSHRLDRRGESRGTGTMTRCRPLCRAYSPMSSP